MDLGGQILLQVVGLVPSAILVIVLGPHLDALLKALLIFLQALDLKDEPFIPSLELPVDLNLVVLLCLQFAVLLDQLLYL